MKRPGTLSLHAKILIVTLMLTLGVAGTSIAVFISNDIPQYQKLTSLFSELMNQSSYINSAILDNNTKLADENLKRLRLNVDITSADIYLYKGKEFVKSTGASIKEADTSRSLFPALDKNIKLVFPIIKHNNQIGEIYIKTKNFNDNIYSIIKVIILLTVISTFIAMFLERTITKSFTSLVDAMKKVTQDNDYSVRIATSSHDDVGTLIQSFNSMLDIIEQNEALQRASQEQIKKLAYYDALTGLPNKDLFTALLRQVLIDAKQDGGIIALLCIEIDNYKMLNDSLSHSNGDLLIQTLAKRISATLENHHGKKELKTPIARLSNDEFVISLIVASSEAAESIAKYLLDAVKEPYSLETEKIIISTSIGIALFPQHGENTETLLKNADIAMNSAKQIGKNCYAIYNTTMNAIISMKIKLEHDLRHAIENDELSLVYQPKFLITENIIAGAETLLRWNSKQGPVSPDEFISLAEESGLIIDIGQWVLREACKQCREWQKQGFPYLQIAVNLSPRQFDDPQLIQRIQNVLTETKLAPKYLELELTEGIIMMNDEKTLRILRALKNLGTQISIDDFGSGYSSLRYLARYPVDKVKIDKSFITHLIDSQNSAIITKTIVDLAHNLNLSVVAEGVETREQFDYLAKIKCDEIQGYLINEPIESDGFTKILSKYGKGMYEA